MTLRRNEHHQPSSAFNSPLPSHNGFSTRTRLRPGGPLPSHFDNPPSSKGSLPCFEDIGMRTLNHQPASSNGQFLLNRRPYFSTMMKNQLPSTPLVKQKTVGCSSPRVQMYRTRVVYSDARDAIKAQEAAVWKRPIGLWLTTLRRPLIDSLGLSASPKDLGLCSAFKDITSTLDWTWWLAMATLCIWLNFPYERREPYLTFFPRHISSPEIDSSWMTTCKINICDMNWLQNFSRLSLSASYTKSQCLCSSLTEKK